jgi:hypothetical protein
MSELTGLTVNVITGEEVIAALSLEEIEFIEKVSAESKLVEQASAAAKASAIAKLSALGLTEEEIAAL